MKKRIFRFVENVILPIMCVSVETTQYLCMSSVFIGISSFVLVSLGKYVQSFLMSILFLTSINHWRDYQLGGWRQRVDMAWVNVCALYGLYDLMLDGTEFQWTIVGNMLICVFIFYRISQLEYKHWSVFHMAIHLYAFFFIPLLYVL